MDRFSVLVVDDETDFRTPLIKRLNKRGLNVDGVGTGEEALTFLAKNNVDVVLLDVRMPGMGGEITLAEIKRLHPSIEVIMLTGHADLQSAIKGLELGAFDYLMKPMEIDEITYKLQDAFKRKSLKKRKSDAENGGSRS